MTAVLTETTIQDSHELATAPESVPALRWIFPVGTLPPVWLGFGGERRLVHPDEPLQDAILNPATTRWQSLVPVALAWRKTHGMD